MTCKFKGWSDCGARLMLGGRRGAAAQLQLSLLNRQSHKAAAAVTLEGINKEPLSHPVKAVKLKLNLFHRVPSLHW